MFEQDAELCNANFATVRILTSIFTLNLNLNALNSIQKNEYVFVIAILWRMNAGSQSP
jgi:hypothetical protein